MWTSNKLLAVPEFQGSWGNNQKDSFLKEQSSTYKEHLVENLTEENELVLEWKILIFLHKKNMYVFLES